MAEKTFMRKIYVANFLRFGVLFVVNIAGKKNGANRQKRR